MHLPRFTLVFYTTAYLLIGISGLNASIASDVIERLVKTSGHFVDDATKAAAKDALSKAVVRYGDEVIETVERGGFGLAEAAARYGDDVMRYAKFSAEAPRALAARAEPMLAIGRRWGDDAVRIEIKAPECAEVLAGSLPTKRLAEIAETASPKEIQRLAALATHCSPREVEAAMTLWRRSNGRVLEYMTPARIAASGFSVAAIVAAWHAPEAFIGLVEAVLTGLLGPMVTLCGWLLVVVFFVIVRKPLVRCFSKLTFR